MSRKSVSRKSMKRKSGSGARKSMARKSVARKSMSRKQSMSKKGRHSGKSPPKVEDKEPWKKDVADLSVSDDMWKCHLSVIQEKETVESGIVDLAGQKAPEGNRWPVRVFSMDYIRDKVFNHCSKSKEATPYSALCDAIKEAAGRNFDQDIPVELLAYFIKYEMLEFREIDIEKKAEKEKYEQEIMDAHVKLDIAAGGRPGGAKGGGRRQSAKGERRQSAKGGRRQSAKGGRRQSAKGGGRRASAKRQSTAKKSIKRQSTAKKSIKRQSTAKKSIKRQSTKRQSTKRQSTKRRQSNKGGRKSMAGGRKSMAGGRKSMAGGRKSMAGGRKSIGGGGSSVSKRSMQHPLLAAWKKKRQNIKYDTKLNAREMPRKDVQYVEDYPVQGPEAYFVITQLRNPDLPKALRDLGLPVDSVIMYNDPRISSEEEKLTPQKIEEYRNLLEELEKDYLFKKSDKRQFFELLKEKYSEQGKLENFWKEFMHQALTQENKKLFEDTIMTKYRPDLKNIPLSSETRKEEMKDIFYEEMSMLMYFMGRISELYKRYNASVKLFEVEAPRATLPEELKIYKMMMDSMPSEACDIPIILDTLLHQVCFNLGTDPLTESEQYGWFKGEVPVPPSTTALEDQLTNLEIYYDLLKEQRKQKPKIIAYPRTILEGDVVKWKSLNLGKMGKYIRDRTYLMQKIFLDRVAWSKVEIDRIATDAHESHLERFRNALGIRDKKEIADWYITLGHLCAMDTPKLWKNENLVFFQEGPVLTLMNDQDKTSTKTLIGSIMCSITGCRCMDKLCETKAHPKIFSELEYLNHIKKIPDYLMYQTIYQLYSDKDVIKKEYNPILDSMVYQFYNAYSTFNVHCRIETPVSLKNFYQHILKEKKQWCLKELSEVSEEDPPKFFKPRMDMLMAHLDSITTPVDVSENLSLTFKDFVDPKSMREDEVKWEEEERLRNEKEKLHSEAKEEKNKKTENKPDVPAPPDPIAAAISQVLKPVVGYVYGLGEDQMAVFHERRKNFVLKGGSRLNLKFDESVFGKPRIMIKLQQNNHTLVFHTPLYQNNNLVNFTFEHENGMMISFSEHVPVKEEDPVPYIKRTYSRTSISHLGRASKISKTSTTRKKQKRLSNALALLNYKPLPEKENPDILKYALKERERLMNLFEKKSKLFKLKLFKRLPKERPKKYEFCDCIMTLLRSRISHLPRPFNYHKAGCKFRMEQFEKNYINKYVSEPFNDPELFEAGSGDQLIEFDLQISWPTGLHVSVLKQPRIGGIYVKQMYLADRKDLPLISEEKYRFVLYNGTVIKYMKSGEIEIFYPWGSIIYLRDVSWTENEVIETDGGAEIVLPKEIAFLRYESFTSDGKQIDYMYGSRTVSPAEYMEEFDDLFCNTKTTDRSDGTHFLYEENGTSIVRFPDGTEIRSKSGFKKYEYFVDWTPEEIEMWFGPELDEEEEEELIEGSEDMEEEEYIRKIPLSKDGFIVVEIWSYSVFHPYFAGVTSGCVEKKMMNLYLPGDTSIQISDRTLYKVLIGKNKDFRMKVGTKQVILDTIKNDRLYQKSILNYTLMRKEVDQNKPKTLFMTRTDDFTDFKIDTKGEINFKILPDRDESLNLAKATMDKRQFLIKQDNSGIEILSKNRVKNLMKQVENMPGAKIDRIRPSKFTHTMMFHPIETVDEYWKMNYPLIKTKNRYVIPSTYGKSYLFPFKLYKNKEKEPKMLLMNLFKTIDFVDKKKTFLDALSKYKESVSENVSGPSCDCTMKVIVDQVQGREDSTLCRHLAEREYRHSTMTGKYFSRYVKNKLVPQLLRMGTKKFNVTRNLKTMRFHLHHIHERSSPIYFESPSGAVFLILQQIIKSAENIVFDIHRCERMDELIDKPMDELTSDMILDLVKCIKPVEMGLGEITKQEVLDVLNSAKQLKEYFPTMREALNYRRFAIVTKGNDFDELECRKFEDYKMTLPKKYKFPLPSIESTKQVRVSQQLPAFQITDKNMGQSLFYFFSQVMKKRSKIRRSKTSSVPEEADIEKYPSGQINIQDYGIAERCEWVNMDILKKEYPEELAGYVHKFTGTKLEKPDILKYLLPKNKKL